MTAILKVDEIQDTSGNLIIKEDSNTITVGASGDTITIPSGATITNSGTATGFGGITEADQFRLTANITGTNADITSNLERTDNSGSTKIGTGMTESSGIFSFPSTGIYLILVQAAVSPYGSDTFAACRTLVTLNNSSYSTVAFAASGNPTPNSFTSIPFQQGSSSFILDVTDTSNVKVKFDTSSLGSGSELRGNTDENQTSFTFIRLGDT